jgi:hypothetical protein
MAAKLVKERMAQRQEDRYKVEAGYQTFVLLSVNSWTQVGTQAVFAAFD